MENHFCIVIFNLVVILRVIFAARNAVIDVSHLDLITNMKRVKEDGIDLVIHKCTQGSWWYDKAYQTRKNAAEKEGLEWAAYHFADGSDGKSQAEHFLRNTGKVKFYALDFEHNPHGSTVGKKQAEDIVKTIKTVTGECPIIYGPPSFLDSLNSKVLAECPLWIASYRLSSPRLPKRWSSWYLWQYTDGKDGPKPHRVNGVHDNIHRSFINS